MGLEELKDEILSNARASAKKMQKEAEDEAEALVESAEEKKKKILESAKTDVKEILEREERERMSSARLKAKMMQADAKEEVVKQIMQGVLEELKEYRESKEYRTLLSKLLEEGLGQIDGDAIVYSNEEDLPLVKKLLSGKKRSEVSKDAIQCVGGVVVTSEDGRVKINNTLEARFDEKKELIRKTVYDMVFG